MTTFIIGDTEIPSELSITMLDLKQKIINACGIDSSYIDISFILDTPVRILGKFNVEPGKMPRTFDRYILDRFAFSDKQIQADYTEVVDYDPDKQVRKPLMSGGRGRGRGLSRNLGPDNESGAYVPPSRETSTFNHGSTQVEMTVEPTFELASEDDFPSLGHAGVGER